MQSKGPMNKDHKAILVNMTKAEKERSLLRTALLRHNVRHDRVTNLCFIISAGRDCLFASSIELDRHQY